MTQSNALMPIKTHYPVPGESIEVYLREINAIPLLSQEEEYELAVRFQREGDLAAAQKLVLSHLRYVVRIAKTYSGYGLALNDLIQEGAIGLMKAVKRFSPDMGVRLVSFGVHWIKAEIHEYVIKNWRIVKVATTKAQRKLFFKLRSAKKRLGWFTAEEVQAVAMDLGVTPKEVVEMEKRLNARDDSLDYFPEDDEGYAHPAHYLEAPESLEPQSSMMNDQEAIQNQQLHYALKTLDERSQDIIKHRWLNEPKAPLKDLAEKHGISIERTRQVEAMALAKLRALLPAEEV